MYIWRERERDLVIIFQPKVMACVEGGEHLSFFFFLNYQTFTEYLLCAELFPSCWE